MAADINSLQADVRALSLEVNWTRSRVSMMVDDVGTLGTSNTGHMRMLGDELKAFRAKTDYNYRKLSDKIGK